MDKKKIPTSLPETEQGAVVFKVPFPRDLAALAGMSPIVVKQPYHIDYIQSYGQDSAWFSGLANGRLLGSRSPMTGRVYATPRGACMETGAPTEWVELPREGRIHTFTVCHFGAEAFLDQVPFVLGLIEFDGVETLLMSRLVGLDPLTPSLDWIGLKVRPKFRRNAKLDPTDVYFVPV